MAVIAHRFWEPGINWHSLQLAPIAGIFLMYQVVVHCCAFAQLRLCGSCKPTATDSSGQHCPALCSLFLSHCAALGSSHHPKMHSLNACASKLQCATDEDAVVFADRPWAIEVHECACAATKRSTVRGAIARSKAFYRYRNFCVTLDHRTTVFVSASSAEQDSRSN